MIWVNAAPARRGQTCGMDISPPAPAASALSLRRLGVAPHRLMFFIGASNLLLAMAWWAAWLAAARWPALLTMHQPQPYAGWLHAFVMQYQMLPSFMFGFLLTTFPKWLGLPDSPAGVMRRSAWACSAASSRPCSARSAGRPASSSAC
jgi:uncharacterized protein involved in response to NO